MNRSTLWTLALQLVVFAGCAEPEATGGKNIADIGCAASDACQSCTGTVTAANVWGAQGCPANFDGVTVDMPCNSPYEVRYTGTCSGLRGLRRSHGGTHSAECFYAPDSGSLVAVRSVDDVLSFCGGTSNTITGGPAPAESCAAQFTKMTQNCP